MQWSHWFAGMMDTEPDDRMYNCLPMYHSVGGVVATGAVLVSGGSVVIREKFSAQPFLGRRRRVGLHAVPVYRRTCAAILSTRRAHPRETRAPASGCAAATALRPTSGRSSRRAFDIPQILEFYAATEGNVSLYNCEGKPGAIGRIPPFLAHRFPLALVKFDVETRASRCATESGFCIRCASDEVGEAIGKIRDGSDRRRQPFEGYTDAAARRRKILRNVFDRRRRLVPHRRPDAQGRAGLLLFRRSGRRHVSLEGRECRRPPRSPRQSPPVPASRKPIVYGVAVPGTEGSAGMAAIVVDAGFDLAQFRTHLAAAPAGLCAAVVPAHRWQIDGDRDLQAKKQRSHARWFRSARRGDAVYFNDRERQAFVPLDARSTEHCRRQAARLCSLQWRG